MFRGDKAEEGHQATRGGEAHRVVQLGDQPHGSDGVDAAETAQHRHRLGVGRLLARSTETPLSSDDLAWRIELVSSLGERGAIFTHEAAARAWLEE